MYDSIFNKIKKCLPANRKKFVVHEPCFKDSYNKNIRKCLSSSYVSTSGDYIDKLTAYLKRVTGAKYVLLTSSGTASLFCALKKIDVNNCEVIVPSMTFVATANSVTYCGGTPNFIDNHDGLNISATGLENYLKVSSKMVNGISINKRTKKIIKCIIIVHAYGDSANITEILKVAKKYKIQIIEDAAGALGSYHVGKHVGTQSRMGILSFNGNKIITTGMGGALLLKNKKDYSDIKYLISTARLPHAWKVSHDKIGYNLRMANLNAALGYGQMVDLRQILKNKKALHDSYKDIFYNDKYCYIDDSDELSANNHWVTNIYLRDKYQNKHQLLLRYLYKKNIFARELWKPMHLLPMYKIMPRSKMTNCIKRWKTGLSLPSCYYK